MFSDTELAIIWFALIAEQNNYEVGSHRWFKYESMIRRIEEKVGATERPELVIINSER